LVTEGEDGAGAFVEWVRTTFPIAIREADIVKAESGEHIVADVFARVKRAYELKVSAEDVDAVAALERQILLHCIDSHWQDYLRGMDALRQGVGLRAYGQRDPLIEYKREAYEMFEVLMGEIKQDVASGIFRSATSVASLESFLSALPQTLVHDEVSLLGGDSSRPAGAGVPLPDGGSEALDADFGQPATAGRAPARVVRREAAKVGRNDPCPCGSGAKYKKCCGR